MQSVVPHAAESAALFRPRLHSDSRRQRVPFARPAPSGAGQLTVVAGLAGTLWRRVGVKASKAGDKQSAVKQEFRDVEFRMLHEHLQELSTSQLEQVAEQASIKLTSKHKRQVVLRLLQPENLEAVKRVVKEEEMPAAPISPSLLRKVKLHMDRVANSRPRGAGRRPVAGGAAVQNAEQVRLVSEVPLQICNVHEPLGHREVERKSLADLKVGDQFSGQVVEISLLDGIRVDIDAEVDALVPVPMMEENDELTHKIAETYRLGSTVKIQIEDVSQDAQRRFPVLGRFQLPKMDFPDWTEGGMALRPQEGTQSLRGRDEVELSQSDDWQHEETESSGDTAKDGVTKALQAVPQRPPPHVVMSISSGKLEAIEVPEQHRQEVLKHHKPVRRPVREAWENLINDELMRLRLEFRCRQRLAKELAAIEAELLQGNAPSVPVQLLGMALFPDGLGCLLPVPDGDCLKFQVREFETAEQMQEWIKQCQSHHQDQWSLNRSQVEGEGPSEKHLLAEFFACGDAWHARAVEAAEDEEIRKLQYRNVRSDDSTEAMEDLERMISKMTSKDATLKMQDEMKHEYLQGLT